MSGNPSHITASLFDPTRLRIARQGAMLRKKELAERVGVSAGAVSQYENGSTTPSARVVAALALALNMPVPFFAADRPLGEVPTTTPHFRSLRATTQQERDRAFSHAILTWELTRTFERHVRIPSLDLPQDFSAGLNDPLGRMEDAARQLRSHWGLGSGPIPHMIRLLESRGVVCTRLPAQTRRVFAFSCSFPGRPVVVLSVERTHRAAGRFDAAHELAHLLVHHDAELGSHAVERQANAFAAEFLAPASEITDHLPSQADWRRLLDLKRVWGISIQALLYRARAIEIMSEHSYRRAVTELNARGWRRQEPGDDGRAERPVLLGRSLAIMGERGITIEGIAEQARLPLSMVRLIVEEEDDRPVVAL